MSELVANCPRCGAEQITFDLLASQHVRTRYDWQTWHEAFCICRNCRNTTIFVLSLSHIDSFEYTRRTGLSQLPQAVNRWFDVEGIISIKDFSAKTPPEHLPENIDRAYREGAICMAVQCHNAAAAMFRLCLDFATKERLPEDNEDGLNSRIRFSLGLRLQWMFDSGRLPVELKELSTCIKEDGNDGAHEGTLEKVDAEDLLDFTEALLERLYTEPTRLAEAKKRREARREQA